MSQSVPPNTSVHPAQVSSPVDFQENPVNPSFQSYSTATTASTQSSSYYHSESSLQNFIDTKPYNIHTIYSEGHKNNLDRLNENSVIPPRMEDSFVQFPHALKHLTDSLTIEPQYQYPRQHLQQFLQNQSQHLLSQQSLTSHMITALHQNGNPEDYSSSSKTGIAEDRLSPISRPRSHLSSSDSSNATPCSWQDNNFPNRFSKCLLESRNGDSISNRYSSSPIYPSHSPSNFITGRREITGSLTGRDGTNFFLRKKVTGFNTFEDEDAILGLSRENSMCPDLPLETTLHEEERNQIPSYLLEKSMYSCSLCSFTCRKQIELTNHVGIHPDEKPFHCTHCDYKGSKYNYLKNHLLIHGTQKVHECPHCEYKSYQRGAVKVHMRKHSEEKKYACPSCPYRTHFNGNLKLHIRVHTGEKPYVCPVCDFRCTQSGSLKIHMRGHSGEKPYACSACDYKTKHKGNLVMHQRKHSGERPFRCELCSYATTQRMGLTKHKKTVHGIDPPPNKGRYPHQIMMYEQLHGLNSPHPVHSDDPRGLLSGLPPHLMGAIKHSPIFLPKNEPLSYHLSEREQSHLSLK